MTRLLAAVWLAGGVGLLLYQWIFYLLARRALLRRARPAGAEDTALLEALRVQMGVRRRVALRRVRGVKTPMMLGLLRPVVLLPNGALPREELAVVLRHELIHLRRGDVAYKALLLAAGAVHWFNPLA